MVERPADMTCRISFYIAQWGGMVYHTASILIAVIDEFRPENGNGAMGNLLLEVNNLKTSFFTDEGVSQAVDGVSFSVDKGEILGIIGESGCGKSVSALSILQLIPSPPGKILGGKIRFEGEDLLTKSASAMRKIRGNDIAMIFQEPMTSLNPVYTIGNQISENIISHHNIGRRAARKQAIAMLERVGISSPEKRVDEYPHQLSGGMRQRAMIAMALSCRPKLLIADEPTTALDVTIQAQILEIIKKLRQEFGMAVIMITHDLGIIAELADKVAVVYAGKVVETADVKSIFKDPRHPYTRALYNSIPQLTDTRKQRLEVIPGAVPNPLKFPQGCRFHPRCRFAIDFCSNKEPQLEGVIDNHSVRCFIYSKDTCKHFQLKAASAGSSLLS